MFHVAHARAAIAAGECEVALIAYGSTQRLVGRGSASVQELDAWEAPFRPPLPVTAYALAASRHMTHAQVAAALGCSEEASRQAQREGLDRLRKETAR